MVHFKSVLSCFSLSTIQKLYIFEIGKSKLKGRNVCFMCVLLVFVLRFMLFFFLPRDVIKDSNGSNDNDRVQDQRLWVTVSRRMPFYQ